jgi:hypothetical protein
MQTIKGDDYITRYDAINNLIYGIYGTLVTSESTVALYQAMTQLFAGVDVKTIHGLIMDFRRSARFDKGTITTVQRESHILNQCFNLAHVPVALVVDTPLQEQIVSFITRVTPDPHRKQIVYSIAEAYAYFDEWHQEQLINV